MALRATGLSRRRDARGFCDKVNDVAGDDERGGGGRGGNVQDVDHVLRAHDVEVIEEMPAAVQGLRAHAGARRAEIGFLQLWHELSGDRKSTRLNSSHIQKSRMPSSA